MRHLLGKCHRVPITTNCPLGSVLRCRYERYPITIYDEYTVTYSEEAQNQQQNHCP